MTSKNNLLGIPRCAVLVFILAIAPGIGWGQTNALAATPAPLPPEAQAALNKGIIAAKVPDYLLAIRYFEEARKLAPAAPEVFYNLGLAESKIPGRELRAIAWFGAYLNACPTAPNAAKVKEQIDVLDVKHRSNISGLIRSVQDTAVQISGHDQSRCLYNTAELWLYSGDITASIKAANLIQDSNFRSRSRSDIAYAQAKNGEIANAQKSADLIQSGDSKCDAQIAIARAQLKAGDLAAAHKTLIEALMTADFIQDETVKSQTQRTIVTCQIEAGDITGAQKSLIKALKTADLIQEAFWKTIAQTAIAEKQLKTGDVAGARKTLASAQKTADLIEVASDKSRLQMDIAKVQIEAGTKSDTQPSIPTLVPAQPTIAISDWLKKLDDDYEHNDCPLNTEPFLDLVAYLTSLQTSEDFQSGEGWRKFRALHDTAKKIVKAQNVITGMLKQQAQK